MPEHLEIRAGVKVTGDSVKEILDEATRVAEAALAVQPPLSKAEEAAIRRIQNATLTLYNILTDATVDEAKRERGKNGSKRLRAGYVDIIPIGTRKYKRGGKAIWPPNNVLRVKKTADLTERSLQKLRLRGVDTFEGRKYVFDFIYGWLIVGKLYTMYASSALRLCFPSLLGPPPHPYPSSIIFEGAVPKRHLAGSQVGKSSLRLNLLD